MVTTVNPRQLVLRRDTATGLTQVGWEADLPIGRFVHLELVCELSQSVLPTENSEHYPDYQAAIQRAREANVAMLALQRQHNRALGWWLVPFELAPADSALCADDVGNCTQAAMQLLFHLTHNSRQVWAVLDDEQIVHVRTRQPRTELDELSYQVWYHQQLHQLGNIEGQQLEGNLFICESGLWFIPISS